VLLCCWSLARSLVGCLFSFDNVDHRHWENSATRAQAEAGRRAFYEYQAQLTHRHVTTRELYGDDPTLAATPPAPSVSTGGEETVAAHRARESEAMRTDRLYLARRLESAALILLDMRFYKTFQSAGRPDAGANAPLIGEQQLKWFREQCVPYTTRPDPIRTDDRL
jgi:hypothetical protein